jgi:hypothetical protein
VALGPLDVKTVQLKAEPRDSRAENVRASSI